MKSVHIRDVDPLVLKRIEFLAHQHQRSVQGELRAILTAAVQQLPSETSPGDAPPVLVALSGNNSWNREDIYGDQGR